MNDIREPQTEAALGHRRRDPENDGRCLVDLQSWPCDAERMRRERDAARAEVREELAARIENEVAPLIVGTKYEVLAGTAVLRAVLAILEASE